MELSFPKVSIEMAGICENPISKTEERLIGGENSRHLIKIYKLSELTEKEWLIVEQYNSDFIQSKFGAIVPESEY